MIAVLGAGPHGYEVGRQLNDGAVFFDDALGIPLQAAVAILPCVVGAMWPQVRRSIVERFPAANWWQDGTVTFPGAQVSEAAKLGKHVHVGYNAVVQHGCKVGDFVTICAGAVLCGDVTVEDDVFIGANATVIHGGVRIGAGATVGAGAVVTHDVARGATVAGVPAREVVG